MERHELWELSPLDFNNWRKENDLLELFKNFKASLPKFDEWLNTYEFTIDFILSTDKPGSFFYWDKETVLITFLNSQPISYMFIPIQDNKHERDIMSPKKDGTQTTKIKFKPYLLWAKEKLGTENIIKSRFAELDTFRFVLINAAEVPEHSRTFIAPGFEVLKLGSIRINGWGVTKHRNLDFSDLDYLEVSGDYTEDGELDIFYSSCRYLKFNNSQVSFTNFNGCHIQNLSCVNSKFYSSGFIKSDVFGAHFENSMLANFELRECSSESFTFNSVEIDRLIFIPPKLEWHINQTGTFKTTSDNYKRFRVLFQNNGHRREASEAYYNERKYELKALIASVNPKRIIEFYQLYGFKHAIGSYYLDMKKYGSILSAIFSFLVWGFGERPIRTVIFSLSIIGIYWFIYYQSLVLGSNNNLGDSLYLSLIMFTTLGFGDYAPFINFNFKLLLASEALLGVFTYGLFVAGYANKSKY